MGGAWQNACQSKYFKNVKHFVKGKKFTMCFSFSCWPKLKIFFRELAFLLLD